MADNISITAGSGTVIATDDVSGAHYQRVKLVDGTLESTAAIPGSATDGLLVNLGANNDVTVTSGSVTVSATNLDIRDLSSASDSVTVAQSTAANLKSEVTNAGTFAVQATLGSETTKVIGTVNIAALQSIEVTQDTSGALVVLEPSASNIMDSVQLIDDTVFIDDAAFTVGSSKVLVSGFLADDATPDASDEGDAVAARCTLDRKQIVMLGESGANFVRGGGAKVNTTDQSIMVASGNASIRNYLCWVSVYNSSSTNTYVNVKDGSTVVAVLPLPAYGGAIFNLPVPIRGTGNTAFNLATGASVTTAYLYGGGYKGY